MPGIVGIISRNRNGEHMRVVKSMVATMMHERHHVKGTFFDSDLEVFAGWVAHEDSFVSNQVFYNEQKDIMLLFSGECFIAPEMKAQLRQEGHVFSHEGGDYLVHLYEQQGSSFFEHLNGLFSGLLIDRRQKKTFLFNDRYGMERIYWHETPDAFYFSSEAKALLRVLPELREFDLEGVAQFLGAGCTLETRTLFRGVQRLPGGSLWTFTGGECRRDSYFSPVTWDSNPILNEREYEEQFQATFKRILPRYFETKSRIGIGLTGGLDTRMIMACCHHDTDHETCYTFTGAHGETLDDKIASRIAAACGLEHHLLRLRPDFFSNFSAHADRTVYITDGTFDILGAHEIYCHRQARELSPIRLTGNYGSEVFRGISMFKPQNLSPQLFQPDFVTAVNSAARQIPADKTRPATFALFNEIPWQRFGSVAAGRSQVVFRTPYLDNELAKLAYQMPQELYRSSHPASRLVRANNKALGEIPTDRGFTNDNSGLSFFWRRTFAEVTFKMDYCYGEGLPGPLMPFNPPFRFVTSMLKVAGMHKFLQYGHWFRDQLAEYIRQRLSQVQAGRNRFFNPKFIRNLSSQHAHGRKNCAPEINAVLTLESVERQLFQELPRKLDSD